MALITELREQGNFLFRHRSYLPIVILVVALAVYIQKEFFFSDVVERQVYELGCLLVGLFGLFIRIITVGYTDDHTSGRNTADGQVADSLNTTGVYSWARHPLYIGNFFMWLGLAAFTQDLWFIIAFVFLYVVYYERIMFAEESYLIDKFGDAYLAYGKSVPAFIPNFKNWKKPRNAFQIKKVIKQEKPGVLGLFTLILLFRVLESLVNDQISAVETHWIVAFCAALLWYIVVKVLQKNTKVLD